MADEDPRHPGYTEEEVRLWENAKCSADYDAVWKMRNERWRREAEELRKVAWRRSEAAEMLGQLGQMYLACKEYLDRQPALEQTAEEIDPDNHRIYARLRSNLERANLAPRCAHIKASGERCRAPKMRGRRFCNMHLAMQAGRKQAFELPVLDDPNSVQLAIMRGAQGLVDGTLEIKQASLLAYYLQLASNKVGKVNFEPPDDEEGEYEE